MIDTKKDVWEDAELISKKWLDLTKLEIYFLLLIIFFDLMNLTFSKYFVLIGLLMMLIMPLYKRKRYDKRKKQQQK